MRWALALLALASPAAAVTCNDLNHLGTSITVCEVSAEADVRLFLRGDDDTILGSFRAVEEHAGKPLVFAMNAGMYHDDRAPVGHYVENGVEQMRVIPNAGPGNFGLLPNGVFCISDEALQVFETQAYLSTAPTCTHATQSGPMLVIDGALHPRFIENGTSKFIRNGVGTSTDGQTAYFAISNAPINFHDFGTLFRDVLSAPNALYFDGKVSRLYVRASGRSDFGWQMGPILGVLDDVSPAD